MRNVHPKGSMSFALKFGKSRLPRLLWIETFDEIALSCTVKEIEVNLCFCIFGKNLKIQNGRHFFRQRKLFGKLPIVHCVDTLWVENFDLKGP